jgi:hypothetical protein
MSNLPRPELKQVRILCWNLLRCLLVEPLLMAIIMIDQVHLGMELY